MKKSLFILSVLVMGVVIAFNTSCEKDPVEACEQDLFCDGKTEVTACCTDATNCYYTYNGKEYPDTDKGLADLVRALDCATTKSGSIDQNNSVAMRLQAMLESVRKQVK